MVVFSSNSIFNHNSKILIVIIFDNYKDDNYSYNYKYNYLRSQVFQHFVAGQILKCSNLNSQDLTGPKKSFKTS